MSGDFELTKEVAEKVLKRAMAPLRELIDANRTSLDESFPVELDFQVVREMDRDLGVLGLTLATKYREVVEYQSTIGVLAEENVRLHNSFADVVTLAEKYRQQAEDLMGALSKTKTVNDKLKQLNVATSVDSMI